MKFTNKFHKFTDWTLHLHEEVSDWIIGGKTGFQQMLRQTALSDFGPREKKRTLFSEGHKGVKIGVGIELIFRWE